MKYSSSSRTNRTKRESNPPMYKLENGKVYKRRAVWMGSQLLRWLYEVASPLDANAVLFKEQNELAEDHLK